MKFRKEEGPPEHGWTDRQVSENNVVHFGIYRVFYGYRVRAGLVRDTGGCSLDWCAGARPIDLNVLYNICEVILSNKPEDERCFVDMPRISDPKPFFNDIDFMARVRELLPVDSTLREVLNLLYQLDPRLSERTRLTESVSGVKQL